MTDRGNWPFIVQFKQTKGEKPYALYDYPTLEGAVRFALLYARDTAIYTTVRTRDGWKICEFDGPQMKKELALLPLAARVDGPFRTVEQKEKAWKKGGDRATSKRRMRRRA